MIPGIFVFSLNVLQVKQNGSKTIRSGTTKRVETILINSRSLCLHFVKWGQQDTSGSNHEITTHQRSKGIVLTSRHAARDFYCRVQAHHVLACHVSTVLIVHHVESRHPSACSWFMMSHTSSCTGCIWNLSLKHFKRAFGRVCTLGFPGNQLDCNQPTDRFYHRPPIPHVEPCNTRLRFAW